MRSLFLVTLMLAAASASLHTDTKLDMASLQQSFNVFKATYGRQYASAAEEEKRFAFYRENMVEAAELAQLNPHATFGDNGLMDMSKEEFNQRLNMRLPKGGAGAAWGVPRAERPLSGIAAPEAFDWRQKGAVTPVKNQGACGSCWAFSTIGTIEGVWAAAGYPLTSFAEQALVTCDHWDQGCQGGYPNMALAWLVAYNKGNVPPESVLPYDFRAPCNKTALQVPGATIINYEDGPRDERLLTAFLAERGPTSVCIDAGSWHSYKSGVLTNCRAEGINHAVLLVGYDTRANPPYWIVKNSWGNTWGESGYIRLSMFNNTCLVGTMPTVPVVKQSSTVRRLLNDKH